MNVIFCDPKLTIGNHKDAAGFFQSCREILDEYVTDMTYISTSFHINRLLSGEIDRNDILIFFNALDGRYCDLFLKLVKKCNDAKCRVWAIAMERNPECRRPPGPVSDRQSFDVSCRN